MPFAREFADLREEMKGSRAGQPELPKELPSAVATFEQLEGADRDIWRHVDLASAFNYLRRHRRLKIPVEWQSLVPDRSDWGS